MAVGLLQSRAFLAIAVLLMLYHAANAMPPDRSIVQLDMNEPNMDEPNTVEPNNDEPKETETGIGRLTTRDKEVAIAGDEQPKGCGLWCKTMRGAKSARRSMSKRFTHRTKSITGSGSSKKIAESNSYKQAMFQRTRTRSSMARSASLDRSSPKGEATKDNGIGRNSPGRYKGRSSSPKNSSSRGSPPKQKYSREQKVKAPVGSEIIEVDD